MSGHLLRDTSNCSPLLNINTKVSNLEQHKGGIGVCACKGDLILLLVVLGSRPRLGLLSNFSRRKTHRIFLSIHFPVPLQMPSCALCHSAEAVIFCVNDDASLCASCDTTYHANPLAARHERRPLACTQKECASAAGCKSESWNDAAVVPQCSPTSAMFDDLFPVTFDDCPLDEYAVDLLGGPMDALPSASDLLDFDFDGVVPSMSEPEKEENTSLPLGNTGLIADSLFPTKVNPFIHFNTNAHLQQSFMVPQEVIIKEEAPVPTVAPKCPRVAPRTLDLDSFMEDEESEMEDDSDDGEFVVAPRRSMTSRARREAAAAAAVPITEPELTRAERVARYREKRARRNFKKTIRYQSRKAYAEIRPRIKGRFVSPEEYAAYTNGQIHHEMEAVVPVF